MTRHGGRGHTVIGPEEKAQYLAHVTAGVPLDEAAAKIGVDRRSINRAAAADPEFATARAAAKAAGRKVRANLLPHGEYRYIHGGCRCTTCRTAASAARQNRRTTPPDPTRKKTKTPADTGPPPSRSGTRTRTKETTIIPLNRSNTRPGEGIPPLAAVS
ncbi:hypothetical protein [Streptomyces sp. NPDC008150]|uniref:hypothetical protein n=1 Tax=Streptomyces sp. NPDC008150 TaxID=3364816 RepID=UPI0036EBE5EC